MERLKKMTSKMSLLSIILTVVLSIYAVLVPPMAAFRYYMGTEIHKAVTKAVEEVAKKSEKNKDEISLIRGVVNSYHPDAYRFWQRGDEITLAAPYKPEP